jgi:hypothetical protein
MTVENLKYAITGHTKGLGQKISQSVDYIGFSRSNGYDISTKTGRNKIIKDSEDCDVFINCAYCGDFSQVDMLYDLFNYWQDKKSLIINIGSETTCGVKKKIWPYSVHKVALDKASEQLSYQNKECRVVNFKFGYINSERVLKNINPEIFIEIEDAANYILDNVSIAFNYRLTEILLRP